MSTESPESPESEAPVSSAEPRRIGAQRPDAHDGSCCGEDHAPGGASDARVFEVRADTIYVSLAFVAVLVTLAYLLGKNTAGPVPASPTVAAPPATALPATFHREEPAIDSATHDDAPAESAPTESAATPPEPAAPAPVAAVGAAVRLQDQMTRADADALAQHLGTLGYGAERVRVAQRPRQSDRFRVEVTFPDRAAAEAELAKLRQIEWKHRSFQDAYLVEPGK